MEIKLGNIDVIGNVIFNGTNTLIQMIQFSSVDDEHLLDKAIEETIENYL